MACKVYLLAVNQHARHLALQPERKCPIVQPTTAVMLSLQGGGNAGLRAWGVAQVASFGKSKQASAQPLRLMIKPKHLQLVIWLWQSCL